MFIRPFARRCLAGSVVALLGLTVSLTAAAYDKAVFVVVFRGASPQQAEGIPVLANKIALLKSSIPKVVREYQADQDQEAIARSIQKAFPSGTWAGVIVIGHSRGGDAAIRFTNRCSWPQGSIPNSDIQLVITLDPVGTANELPKYRSGEYVFTAGQGKSATNYYTTLGTLHGHRVNGARNLDLTDDRHTCVVGRDHRFTHTAIDDCEKIQAEVVGLVREHILRWERKPPPPVIRIPKR